MKKKTDIIFEESLSDDWSRDLDVVEVPLDDRPLFYVGLAVVGVVVAVVARLVFLNVANGDFYARRAAANLLQEQLTPAPRGLIVDRNGVVLAENQPAFAAALDVRAFLQEPDLEERTLEAVSTTLGISPDTVLSAVSDRNTEQSSEPIILSDNLTQSQLVALKALGLKTLTVTDGYRRSYPKGPVFSTVLGYVGYPSPDDLRADDTLTGQDVVGKSGIEAEYDKTLRGQPGVAVQVRDAKGRTLTERTNSEAKIGATVQLTIDGEFQEYFYQRFREALTALGRTSGAGLAIDPTTGAVLAFFSMPSYDNNVMSGAGSSADRVALLNDSTRPLFDRLLGGMYNPGSTIKPLHGVAALTEGVITPTRQIFSPGYLDVPNPYDPEHPTRFVDWRYQGYVNMAAALAQSSNVYFYEVGGGFGDIKGLGIDRLDAWWQKFRLDKPTGIDLPGENTGFLPTIEWKKQNTNRPWQLGDTYNVSIGQGDLLVTPIALLNYIAAIANGGYIYQPFVNASSTAGVALGDLTTFAPAIAEVQKGMRLTVTSPMGTAHLLDDLSIPSAAKTGSAQVFNKTQENAFFVGYLPADHPKLALLILVENSKEGSLNAVPIAHDVFAWYAEHRLKK
ncbi:MAG TPA: penicillin-binding protein 2 [Candidatus Paceibacterota bacterium]|nr:penicillin-binding protein 2 [Candidatus Paceibacterota bacterium]